MHSRLKKSLRIVAAVVSILGVFFGLLPGILPGASEFSASLALNVLTVVVLTWTAELAAENLIEFRISRDVEFEPIIDVVFPEAFDPVSNASGSIGVRNLGRGTATRIRVRFWRPETGSREEWFPITLDVPGLIGPGETADVDLRIPQGRLFWSSGLNRIGDLRETASKAHFVVQVLFHTPRGDRRTSVFGFADQLDPETSRRRILPVSEGGLPKLEVSDRAGLIRRLLKELEASSGENWGPWGVDQMETGFMLHVEGPEGKIGSHRSAKDPVAEIVTGFMGFIRKHSPRLGSGSESALLEGAGGESPPDDLKVADDPQE